MLYSLHVKNLALIRDASVSFGEGLQVLTGETGAGKSILIDSIMLVLGGRFDRNLVGTDGKPFLAELLFYPEEDVIPVLEALGLCPDEDGTLLVSRRIENGRSLFRANGSIVPVSVIRKAAPHLIDVYGQNEHQSLTQNDFQLQLLDSYGGETIRAAKENVRAACRAYREMEKTLASLSIDEADRARRTDLLRYETEEIRHAGLREGEDGELEDRYRFLSNAQKIAESLSEAHRLCGYDGEGAGDLIGAAIRSLSAVSRYDRDTEDMLASLTDIDGLLNDFNRTLSSHLDDLETDDGELAGVEDRLNTVNRLKMKYGGSIASVLSSLDEKEAELEKLNDLDTLREKADKDLRILRGALDAASDTLHKERERAAERFSASVSAELESLNFAACDFAVDLIPREEIGENGADIAEFMISTNPGEEMHPLRLTASGGELSRIMLGIKTIFADREDAGTLIFDEIDTGISGRTAQKVAEKLRRVSRSRQVICITHLPQIAAMADIHFLIEKESASGRTETKILRLSDEDIIDELARMLGGAKITGQTKKAAAEMKALAAGEEN